MAWDSLGERLLYGEESQWSTASSITCLQSKDTERQAKDPECPQPIRLVFLAKLSLCSDGARAGSFDLNAVAFEGCRAGSAIASRTQHVKCNHELNAGFGCAAARRLQPGKQLFWEVCDRFPCVYTKSRTDIDPGHVISPILARIVHCFLDVCPWIHLCWAKL